MDASLLSDEGVASMGLIRDVLGGWLVSFAGGLGQQYILLAKFMAIKMGLQFAWDYGIQHLICHSYSHSAVALVLQEVEIHHRYANVILEIQAFMHRDWNVIVEHTLR